MRSGHCQLFFPPSPASSPRFTATAKVGEDHYDQVGDEPDVVGTHVLVYVDQDQYPRCKDAKQDIRPLRNRICGVETREKEQVHQQYDAREKQGKNQEIYVHLRFRIGLAP